MSSRLNAFDKDNIGLRCLIFLNLFEGVAPTEFYLLNQYFLKMEIYFLNQLILFLFYHIQI